MNDEENEIIWVSIPYKEVNWKPGDVVKIEENVYGESALKKIIEQDFPEKAHNITEKKK